MSSAERLPRVAVDTRLTRCWMAWESRELIPDGVNVGGWFCLEDWFYSQATATATSGSTNPKATASTTTVGHLVATPNLDYEKHRFQLNREKLVGHVCSIFALTATEDREAARRAHQWVPWSWVPNERSWVPFTHPLNLTSSRLKAPPF